MTDEKSLVVYVDKVKDLAVRPIQAAWGWLTGVGTELLAAGSAALTWGEQAVGLIFYKGYGYVTNPVMRTLSWRLPFQIAGDLIVHTGAGLWSGGKWAWNFVRYRHPKATLATVAIGALLWLVPKIFAADATGPTQLVQENKPSDPSKIEMKQGSSDSGGQGSDGGAGEGNAGAPPPKDQSIAKDKEPQQPSDSTPTDTKAAAGADDTQQAGSGSGPGAPPDKPRQPSAGGIPLAAPQGPNNKAAAGADGAQYGPAPPTEQPSASPSASPEASPSASPEASPPAHVP